MRFLIYIFLWHVVFWHTPSYSHSHSVSSSDNLLLVEQIFNKAVTLAPEVLSISEETKISTPYFKAWGLRIPLNSGFRELMRGWLRLYKQSIEEYCPCPIPEEALLKQAEDNISKGFFSTKVRDPSTRFGEGIALTLYGYSARYGKVAALMKASAEVVEHSLALFSLGKGVHIFCNVIDVMIFFILRKTQTFVRIFNGANHSMNKNKGSALLMAFRSSFLSWIIKGAKKKVFFHLETATINPKGLAEADHEGLKKQRREAWVRSLSTKVAPLVAQIEQIDRSLEQENHTDKEKIKLLKKRGKLYKKMEKITQVHYKNFFGKRYKRFAFLFSRKSSKTYLKGNSFADSLVGTSEFWPTAIQENILQQALVVAKKEGLFPVQNHQSRALKTDGVRAGLAKEFVNKINQTANNARQAQHIHYVERKLMDIDNIFNADIPIRKRYFLVQEMEWELAGFFEHYLRMVYKKTVQQNQLKIKQRFRLRWQLQKFIYYVFAYADFLRMVSMVKDKSQLFLYKHKAMENYLIFYEYLSSVSRMVSSSIKEQDKETMLEANLQKIISFQIQREKRTAFSWWSWLPFYTPTPYCRNLIRTI